jgi:hypothetical protein
MNGSNLKTLFQGRYITQHNLLYNASLFGVSGQYPNEL